MNERLVKVLITLQAEILMSTRKTARFTWGHEKSLLEGKF